MINKLRIANSTNVESTLASLSNIELEILLEQAEPYHSGIGGESSTISFNETKIFVKKIPLTNFEQKPENIQSTYNLFDLPLFYQYGVGSAGFGAWRELQSHIMASNWVLTKQCASFPILYHWRVLPRKPVSVDISYWKNIDRYTEYWNKETNIRDLLHALNASAACIALFIEYVPQTLSSWLSKKVNNRDASADLAIEFVDSSLFTVNKFLQNNGFIHFDLHFENILTDGNELYLSDFGLAVSSNFELTIAEKQFLKKHNNYDVYCAALNILHCIITARYGKEEWINKLKKHIKYMHGSPANYYDEVIMKYHRIAILMDCFLTNLQKDKQTLFPAEQLAAALASVIND